MTTAHHVVNVSDLLLITPYIDHLWSEISVTLASRIFQLIGIDWQPPDGSEAAANKV